MEITVDKKDLLNLLNLTRGITPKSTTEPILLNTRLFSQNGNLVLEATSGDMTVIAKIKGVDFDWETAFPTEAVYTTLNSLSRADKLNFVFNQSGDAETLAIKSGKTKRLISCLPTKNFPRTQNFENDEATTFTLPAEKLLKMISKAKISISTYEARSQLNGLCFEGRDDHLHLVSTNGHMLSLAKTPIAPDLKMPATLVPKKAVLEIEKTLTKLKSQEKVLLSFTQNKVKLEAGGFTLISKLLDYEFPAYERVIPFSNYKIFEASKYEFLSAIEEATTALYGTKETAIKILLQDGESKINAKVGGEMGDSSFEANFDAEAMETLYNHGYWEEILKSIHTGKVKVHFGDSNKPCLITPTDPEDNIEYLYVVMPIRI